MKSPREAIRIIEQHLSLDDFDKLRHDKDGYEIYVPHCTVHVKAGKGGQYKIKVVARGQVTLTVELPATAFPCLKSRLQKHR